MSSGSGPGMSGFKRIRRLKAEKVKSLTKNVGNKGTGTSNRTGTSKSASIYCGPHGDDVYVGTVMKNPVGTKRCYGGTVPTSTHSSGKKSFGDSGSCGGKMSHLRTKEPAATKTVLIEQGGPSTSKTRCSGQQCPPKTASQSHDYDSEWSGYESDESVEAPKYKKVVRGVSRDETLERFVQRHGKYKISFLPGETISVNNNPQFSSGIGIITRSHADIGKDFIGWEDVSEHSKDFCYARLGHWFDIEDGDTLSVQQIIDDKFRKAYTSWRYMLHSAYDFLVSEGINPRNVKVSPRDDCTLEKWIGACDFIEDENYQKRSKINFDNREKLVLNHTSGRTAFLSRFKTMQSKSEIGLFKVTYSKRKGNKFVNKAAETTYNKMVNKLKEAAEKGEQIPESEIVKITLGHKSGYIKGMGRGLQVVRGNISSTTAGIDINKKLSELDTANEKLVNLTNVYEEQKNAMEKMKGQMLKMQKMQKIMEKLPGFSELLTEDMDVEDGQA